MEKGQEQPPAYSPYPGGQQPPQGYQYGQYQGQPQPYGQPGQPQPFGQSGQPQPYGQPGQPPMYPPPQGQPMAPQYMHQQQYSNVVVQQPMTGTAIVAQPPDYMTSAILVTLCCFWPTGVIAIIKANEARNAMMRGDMVMANSSARSAKTMINISVLAGVCSIIFVTIIIGIYWGIVMKNLNDNDYDY